MQPYRRRGGLRRGLIIPAIAFAAVLILAVSLLDQTGTRVQAEQLSTLRSALRRASVTCYALEGRYPPTLAYLTENYGVMVDADKFIVQYSAFAQNIMPIIEVKPIGGEGPDEN